MPMLAGIPISRESVLRLAADVDEPAAGTLEAGLDADRHTIALTILEREQILRCLDDHGIEELAELRAVLLKEHEWRVRIGLV